MNTKTLLLGLIVLAPCLLQAQALPDTLRLKVDSLFKKWDVPNKPGCVVGIIRNDSVLYAKGFGLANLENNIAATPQTIYYMCSVSKQFAGYAIALLARQGKLKLEDDIHLYLPWMAQFGKPITIRHLLNHTSGLRDDLNMISISGTPDGAIITQDYALKLLKNQRTLNFAPGEKYQYSNSNFVLLAEIVRVASGQSFRAFTNEQIFKPLGMTNTRFVDDGQELIVNRAPSYGDSKGGTYKNLLHNVYTLGDGGLFTNLDDMTRWIMNFYSPRAGDAKDIEQLTQRTKLNNGKLNDYALGIAVDEVRGWKRYIHNGSLAGYRTIIAVYPDLKMGFVVFGNGSDNDVYAKSDQLAALFVPEKSTELAPKPPAPLDSALQVLKQPQAVQELTGAYIGEDGYQLRFSSKDGKFWMNSRALVQVSVDSYYVFVNPAIRFGFHRGNTSTTPFLELISPAVDKPLYMEKLPDPLVLIDGVLNTYTGNYYSPELDCTYVITLKDGQLYLGNFRRGEGKITVLGGDHLVTNLWPMQHLKLLRNAKNKVIGFEINTGGFMHLVFNKMD